MRKLNLIYLLIAFLYSCNSGGELKKVYTNNLTEMLKGKEEITFEQLKLRKQFDTTFMGYVLGSLSNDVSILEEKLKKSGLIINKSDGVFLNIPDFPNFHISKSFYNNKLLYVSFFCDESILPQFGSSHDFAHPLFDKIESFLYKKYGFSRIYYCPKDGSEAISFWIKGDLTINLRCQYLEIRPFQGRSIFKQNLTLSYSKNSINEERIRNESMIKAIEQEKKQLKERAQRDSISKYF